MNTEQKLEAALTYIVELKTALKEARAALPDEFNIEGDSVANNVAELTRAYRHTLTLVPPF